MNKILEQVNKYMHEALKSRLPEISTADLEDTDKIMVKTERLLTGMSTSISQTFSFSTATEKTLVLLRLSFILMEDYPFMCMATRVMLSR